MKANTIATLSLLCIALSLGLVVSDDGDDVENLINLLSNEQDANESMDDANANANANNIDANNKAAKAASSYIMADLEAKITTMFGTKVKTSHCRAKITTHFRKYVSAIANETPLPFSEEQFNNECSEPPIDFNNIPEGESKATLMQRTYQPPRENATYIEEASDLKLLYGILTHGKRCSESTIRLMETLNGENTIFAVHVDGKEISDESYHTLVEYAANKDHVHIVPNEFRVRVNWGGFSIANATLQILKYAFALLPQSETSIQLPKEPLNFHKFVHLSATTYPIRSNTHIRNTIASYPLDANLFKYFNMEPLTPSTWNYYVECDDAVHRIYRLHPLTAVTNGISQYMGSNWFIISNEFAKYLAEVKEGTFVQQYIKYAERVATSDEIFFASVLKNSQFCTKHHNSHFLHHYFDRYESELDAIDRDQSKCLYPNPDHCGRSPAILTKDYLVSLELTDSLFARKFSDDDLELKDIFDHKREEEEEEFRDIAAGNHTKKPSTVNTTFEGYGTLIVAKETVSDHNPLCLGLGEDDDKVKLVPCFHEDVLPTLGPGWETGGVIEDEVLPNNRWIVGPCSSDGSLKRNYKTGEMEATSGRYSPTGPQCKIQQMGGAYDESCMDIYDEQFETGGILKVYDECLNQWYQWFSFGDGIISRNATIFGSVPTHLLKTLKYKGKDHSPHLCFGVAGRSKNEYTPWREDRNEDYQFTSIDFIPRQAMKKVKNGDKLLPLRLWEDKQILMIPCTDEGAVVDFVTIPFIEEEEDPLLVEEGKDPSLVVEEDPLKIENEVTTKLGEEL